MKRFNARSLSALVALVLVLTVAGLTLFTQERSAEPQENNAGELTNPLIFDFGDGPRMISFSFLGISFRKLSLPERIFWGKLKSGDAETLQNIMSTRYYFPQRLGMRDMKAYLDQLPLGPALDAAGMKFHMMWKQPFEAKIKMEGMEQLPPQAQALISKAMGADKAKAYLKIVVLPSAADDRTIFKSPGEVGRVALTPLGFVFLGLLKYADPAFRNADQAKMMGAMDQVANGVQSLMGAAPQSFNDVAQGLGNAKDKIGTVIDKVKNLGDASSLGDAIGGIKDAASAAKDAAGALTDLRDRAQAAGKTLRDSLDQLAGQASELQKARDQISNTSQGAADLARRIDQSLSDLNARREQLQSQLQKLQGFQDDVSKNLGKVGDLINQGKDIAGTLGNIGSGIDSLVGEMGGLTDMFNGVSNATSNLGGLIGKSKAQRFNKNTASDFFSSDEIAKTYTIAPTLDLMLISNQMRGDGDWNTVFPIATNLGSPLIAAATQGRTPIVGFVGLMFYPIQFGIPLPPIPNSFALRFLGPVDQGFVLPYAWLSIPLFGGDPSIAFFHSHEVNRGIPPDEMSDQKVQDPAAADNRTKKENRDNMNQVQDAAAAIEDRRMNGPIQSVAARPLACFAVQDAINQAARAADDTAGGSPLPDSENPASKGFKAALEGEAAAAAAARAALSKAAVVSNLAAECADRLSISGLDTSSGGGGFFSIGDAKIARDEAKKRVANVSKIDLKDKTADNPPDDPQVRAQIALLNSALAQAAREAHISFCRACEAAQAAAEGEDCARAAASRTRWAVEIANRAEQFMGQIAGTDDLAARKHLLRVTQAASRLAQRTADVASIKANTAEQCAARAGEAGFYARQSMGPAFPQITPEDRLAEARPSLRDPRALEGKEQEDDVSDPQLRGAVQSGDMLRVTQQLARLAQEHADALPDQPDPVDLARGRALTVKERLTAIQSLALRAAGLASLAAGQALDRARAAGGLIGENQGLAGDLRARADALRQQCASSLEDTNVLPLKNWKSFKGSSAPTLQGTREQMLDTASKFATQTGQSAQDAADAAEAAEAKAQLSEARAGEAFASLVEIPLVTGIVNAVRAVTLAGLTNPATPSPLEQQNIQLSVASLTLAAAAGPLRVSAILDRRRADDLAWLSILGQVDAQEAAEQLDDLRRKFGITDDAGAQRAAADIRRANALANDGDVVGARAILTQVRQRGIGDIQGRQATQIDQGLRSGLLMTAGGIGDQAKFFSGSEIRHAADTGLVLGQLFPNDRIGNLANDLSKELALPKVTNPADPELAAISNAATGGAGGAPKGPLPPVVLGLPGAGFGELLLSTKGSSAAQRARIAQGAGAGAPGSNASASADAKRRFDEAKLLFEQAQRKEQAKDFLEALRLYSLIIAQFGGTGFPGLDVDFARLSQERIRALMADPAVAKLVDDAAQSMLLKAEAKEDLRDYADALKLYRLIVSQFPTSRQAVKARQRAATIEAALAAGKADELSNPASATSLSFGSGAGAGGSAAGAALDARVSALFDAASGRLAAGQLPEAVAAFFSIAAQYPDHPKGKLAAEQRDALLAQPEVVRKVNESAKALFQRGQAAEQGRRTRDAIEAYSSLLANFPTSSFVADSKTRLSALGVGGAAGGAVAGDAAMDGIFIGDPRAAAGGSGNGNGNGNAGGANGGGAPPADGGK